MNFFKQIILLAITHARILFRNRRAAFFGLLLSIAYLVVGTQILVVTFGNRLSVGVFTKQKSVFKDVKKVMEKAEIKTIRYINNFKGENALKNGKIVALISLANKNTSEITLSLSGKNPMLDRQIAALLLAATPALSSNASKKMSQMKIKVKNIEVAPTSMITFMTAGLLPFLILHLALTYCGQFWVNDWENGQLFTLLFTPVRRIAIVIGRSLGAMFFIMINLLITLTICRYVVTWQLPPKILLWFLLIFTQIFTAIGFNFFFAAICKKFVLYLNVIIVVFFLLSFISGVFSPIETLPRWEQILSSFTPTFYAVRSMQAVMLNKTPLLAKDFLMLITFGIIFYTAGYFLLAHSTIDNKIKG